MGIRGVEQLTFIPSGITDSFDELDAFQGACTAMSNLILDSSNPDQLVARPGVGLPVTTFTSFTIPTFVSLQVTVGTMTYGMVSSSRYPGYDEPFAWDNVHGVFIAISGVTGSNLPVSPATTGAWTPPTAAMIAGKLVITHPGFSGVGTNFFGLLNLSIPSAPAWSTSNTATNALPSVPTSVANYNNRAWFACGNLAYYSDALQPAVMSTGTQSLTIGDSTPIVGQNGLPMQTVSSGMTAALILFKANQVWMATGDSSTNNLSLQFLSLTIGCQSPRSIAQTPIGVIFIGQDAPYIVLQSAIITELHHPSSAVADLCLPFLNAQVPSRVAAAFAGNIYRVCVQTLLNGSVSTNDYWFDLRRMRWSGPHTFVYDCASQYDDSFILSGASYGAALFVSSSTSTIYTDNSASYGTQLQTTNVTVGDTSQFKQIVESTMDFMSGGQGNSFALTAKSGTGLSLATAYVYSSGQGSLWGYVTWGNFLWSSTNVSPYRYDIYWNQPIVSDRISFLVTTYAASPMIVGKLRAKYQVCGYTLRPQSGVIPGNLLDINFILDQSTLS